MVDLIKRLNGKGKIVMSISVVTLVTLISTILIVGRKYYGAEMNIKKVPTIEEDVRVLKQDMGEMKVAMTFIREDTKEIKSLLRRR